jgi:hypothetical protein
VVKTICADWRGGGVGEGIVTALIENGFGGVII